MNDAEFQLRGVSDPRLAVHAASRLPAWLWSTDGTGFCGPTRSAQNCLGRPMRRPRGENLRPRRSASASGGAAVRSAAADRRDAAGTAARFWRGTRHAGDLRLRAAGFSRWRRRRAGGRDADAGRTAADRCRAADRAAPRAPAWPVAGRRAGTADRPSRRPGISWSSHCPNRLSMRRSSRRISRTLRRWTNRRLTMKSLQPPARRRPNLR